MGISRWIGPHRRAAGLRWAMMHSRRSSLTRPTDAPSVRADAPAAALRVLLIGNGLVHGWGVSSHQLAPTGELARGVRTLTSSACEVVYVGDAAMSVATAAEWVADRADASYDCAVVAIGGSDALLLTPMAEWGARLAELLDVVQAGLGEDAPVLVVGIPEVFVPNRVRPLGAFAALHARRLDRVTARLAAVRRGVRFVPAPRLADLAGSRGVRDLYARFSTPIAVAVAEACGPGRHEEQQEPEHFERPAAAAIIEAARWDELSGLQRVVELAKAEFGVDESAVTLLDGDRTWHVAHNGGAPTSMPRSLSYCEAVVATGDPLVVPDARRNPRYADNAFLRQVHAPFYAGVPVHDADGTPIGALCLLNGSPRAADSVDLDRLRELARQAETMLHEAVRPQPVEPAEVLEDVVPEGAVSEGAAVSEVLPVR